MTIEMPLWHEAAAFAARAHRYDVQKDGVTPYVAHPMRVALRVATLFNVTDETILTAALLHDVIEDCDCDYEDVAKPFGEDVAQLVRLLSKDMRLPEAEREAQYDRQLAEGPWQARLIKLADVYDNMSTRPVGVDVNSLLRKARRALDLAKDDAPLAEPRRIVQQVADELEGSEVR